MSETRMLIRHQLFRASAMVSVAASWRGWCARRGQAEFVERGSDLLMYPADGL